jgi:hypothetical protein
MFGAFGDVKRRQPVFTFKRGAVFSAFSDHNKRTIEQPQQLQQKQPVTIQAASTVPLTKNQLHISPSSSNSTTDSDDPFEFPIAIPPVMSSSKNVKARSKKQEKTDKEGDDSIFDFPDSLAEFSEVKLMVASTRTVPEMPKLTRTRSKSKTKSKSAPSTPKATTTTTSKKKDTPIASKSESTANTNKKRVASLDKKSSVGILAATTSKTHAANTNKRPPVTLNTANRSLAPARNCSLAPNSNYLSSVNTLNSQPFDIFAFDPSPPSHLSYNKNTTTFIHNTTTTTTTVANNSYNPYISSFSSNPVYSTDYYNNDIVSSNLMPFDNSTVALPTTSNWHHPVSIASLLNDTTQAESVSNFFNAGSTQTWTHQQQSSSPTVAQTQPVEKKRKRNLVAHLKSATGETENKPLSNRAFDFLSDEEELLEQQSQNDLLPLREIISNKERSLSPELTYAQRMELELDTMMQSEFGTKKHDNTSVTDETQRRRYQPLNKVNVRVTFQKK